MRKTDVMCFLSNDTKHGIFKTGSPNYVLQFFLDAPDFTLHPLLVRLLQHKRPRHTTRKGLLASVGRGEVEKELEENEILHKYLATE